MCGIAGVVRFDDKPVTAEVIRAMTTSLSHRGPDDRGHVLFAQEGPVSFRDIESGPCAVGTAALGHRRLSIIDLSESGHQPMSTPDGRIWVVLNGEIYNYVELRKELEQRGHIFRSRTDTEVALVAYAEWGVECFSRFNGMWAMAFYDAGDRSLILSRGRFGKKPLYYHKDSRRIVFASEPKAIFMHPDCVKKPDFGKIANYAGRHYRRVDQDDRSFFEGVEQVPKSSFLKFDTHGNELRSRYWTLKPGDDLTLRYSEAELIEQFRSLLDDAIRVRLQSDVPVGALLSGGLDSTSIVSLMARRHPNLKTFSSVPGEGRYDESPYIKAVVEKTGVDATIIYPKHAQLVPTLREMLQFHDEPVCTVTWFSMYLMMKELAHANVPVVLTGHAGDELLGGYWSHYHYHFYDLRHSGAGDDMEHEAWLANHGRSPDEYNAERENIEALVSAPPRSVSKFSRYLDCLREPVQRLAYDAVRWVPFQRALNRRSYLELFYETVPAVLRAEDRNCMAFAIENRVPFLDHRLVEFAFRLPGRYKIRNGLGKWLLREAMKGVLPEQVRTRKDKAGHTLPFDAWIRGELRTEFEGLMARKGIVNDEIYDMSQVRTRFKEHLQGQDHYMFFWQYLNMHMWYEEQFERK